MGGRGYIFFLLSTLQKIPEGDGIWKPISFRDVIKSVYLVWKSCYIQYSDTLSGIIKIGDDKIYFPAPCAGKLQIVPLCSIGVPVIYLKPVEVDAINIEYPILIQVYEILQIRICNRDTGRLYL